MTTTELTAIAEALRAQIPTSQTGEFLEVCFDVFYANSTSQDREAVLTDALNRGMDYRPICKRKYPA